MPIKKIVINKANRLYQMPPDILSFVPPERQALLLSRPDLIDLARLRWPAPPPSDYSFSADSLRQAGRERLSEFREQLADWLAHHFGVKLSPHRELFIGGSITSLVFGLSMAHLDAGDVAFVPQVGLPLYRKAIIACGGETMTYSLTAKSNWAPSFERLATPVGRVARMLFINNPHNPTGSELSETELTELVRAAAQHQLLIVNDAGYRSIANRKPVSLLSIDGADKVGVELHSFSYLLGLPWMPFGFAAGHREAISGLEALTSAVMPVSIPNYYLDLALQGMNAFPSPELKDIRQSFTKTAAEANPFVEELRGETAGSPTVPCLWLRLPHRRPSVTLARLLYRRYRILVAPGTGFGEQGQGYLRLSLTCSPEQYQSAVSRLRKGPIAVRGTHHD